MDEGLEEGVAGEESIQGHGLGGRYWRSPEFFYSTPDEVERPVPLSGDLDEIAPVKPVDALDQLAEFAEGLPAWVGPDGYPLSWRHFVYGLAYIRRRNARAKIEMASAMRIAKADQQGFEAWRREVSMYAGI